MQQQIIDAQTAERDMLAKEAYLNATRRFAEWCEAHDLHQLAQVEPFHVAAFVKELQRQFSAPTVKQHLAALRMLFDWLVTGHVIDVNTRQPRLAAHYQTL
jgi:integrase/recombinase XerD